MERLARRYFEFVTARPWPVLVIAAIVGLALGAQILHLTRETNPDAFIPEDHPALLLKSEIAADFGLKDAIAVGVIRDAPGGIFNPATLALVRDLTQAIQDLPEVDAEQVMSIATESGVFFDEGVPGFDRLMPRIPDDEAGLDRLKENILGYELYSGTLVAADGNAAAIVVRMADDLLADETYRALRNLIDGFPVNDETLVVAGEAAVRTHMGKAVSDDALKMNFICPIVMAFLIIIAYRTLRGTLLPLCVIGGGSVFALGFMSLAGVPIYIITNGIFVVIMALGVADSLHLLGQYYEEQLQPDGRSARRIIVSTCLALWYPLLITSLTDIAGFMALYFGGVMPPIRYFGLFTSLGVLGALLYSYTVIPAGLAILPLKSSRVFERRLRAGEAGETAGADGALDSLDTIGRAGSRLGRFICRRPVAVLVGSVLIITAASLGATQLVINDARILAFKDDHPLVQATSTLNDHFDGTNQLEIVVTASEEGSLIQPELLERIEELEAFSESLPAVGGTHSVAGWIKRAHQKMNGEDEEYFAIPEDPFEVAFYLDVLSAPTSPMAELLHEVIDDTRTRAVLLVRMNSSEFIHEREVVEGLEAYISEQFDDGSLQASLAGRVHLDYHWLRMVRTSHIRSVLFSSLCVLLLTGLMFRSVSAGVLCLITIGVAVLVNYALMGLLEIPLGVGTSMFASIAIGAGVNFPIHILDRLRIGFRSGDKRPADVLADTLAYTGRALFFTAFVVAIGFMLLVISEFRTLIRFGFLISVATAVSFIASITLLPALVLIMRPRFIWGKP